MEVAGVAFQKNYMEVAGVEAVKYSLPFYSVV